MNSTQSLPAAADTSPNEEFRRHQGEVTFVINVSPLGARSAGIQKSPFTPGVAFSAYTVIPTPTATNSSRAPCEPALPRYPYIPRPNLQIVLGPVAGINGLTPESASGRASPVLALYRREVLFCVSFAHMAKSFTNPPNAPPGSHQRARDAFQRRPIVQGQSCGCRRSPWAVPARIRAGRHCRPV